VLVAALPLPARDDRLNGHAWRVEGDAGGGGQALSELRLIFTMRRNAESMDQFLTQLALDLEAEEDRRG
jgi:hypothetical protein